MVLIENELIKNVPSKRKQISNVHKYVYHTLEHFSDTGNDAYTKSVLANAVLKFHTKPTFSFVGQKEQRLDEEIENLYGQSMLNKVDEMKKPYRNRSELQQYVPDDKKDGDKHNSLNLQLTPQVKENCLTGYGDAETIENAVIHAYTSPFKSRLDRIDFKENLINYHDEKKATHRVLDAIVNNKTDEIENADEIELNDEWYRNNRLTLTQAKERVKELGQKDKKKKLMALKRVCMNEGKEQSGRTGDYVRYSNAVQYAMKIFNVHPRTAENYVDQIIRFEKDPVIEVLTPSEELPADVASLKKMKGKSIQEGMTVEEAKRIVQKSSKPPAVLDDLIEFDSGLRITEFKDDSKI